MCSVCLRFCEALTVHVRLLSVSWRLTVMTTHEASRERDCPLAPRQHLLQGDNAFLISELRTRVRNHFWINLGPQAHAPHIRVKASVNSDISASPRSPPPASSLLLLAPGLCSVPGTPCEVPEQQGPFPSQSQWAQ